MYVFYSQFYENDDKERIGSVQELILPARLALRFHENLLSQREL